MTLTRQTHALETNEILCLIESFLEERQDLGSCSLVCHQWYAVFAPRYWWVVLNRDMFIVLYKKLQKHQSMKRQLQNDIQDRKRQEEAIGELYDFDLPPLQQKQQSQPQQRLPSVSSIVSGSSAPKATEFYPEVLDKVFYDTLAKDIQALSVRMGYAKSTKISANSLMLLMLLAGPRSDLKNLCVDSLWSSSDRSVYVPPWALPHSIRRKVLGDHRCNNDEKSTVEGKQGGTAEVDDNDIVSFPSTPQMVREVLEAILAQNRGLESIRFQRATLHQLSLTGTESSRRTLISEKRASSPSGNPLQSDAEAPAANIVLPASWWWPNLRRICLDQCNVEQDSIPILLANTPTLEHLSLDSVCVSHPTTTTTSSHSSPRLIHFGSPASKSISYLELCDVKGIPLWIQLDFARATVGLRVFRFVYRYDEDSNTGEFMRAPSSQFLPLLPTTTTSLSCTTIGASDLAALDRMPYSSALVGFLTLEEIMVDIGRDCRRHLDGFDLDPTSPQARFRVSHIFDSICTAPVTNTQDLSPPSSSLSRSRRIVISHCLFHPNEMTLIIHRHGAWLETLELIDIYGVSGKDLLLVLQQCPRLGYANFKCPHVAFVYQDPEYDLTQPWACRDTLQSLTMPVAFKLHRTLGTPDIASDSYSHWGLNLETASTDVLLDLDGGSESDDGRGDNEVEDPELILSQALIRQNLFLERLGSLVSLRELSLTTEDYPLPKHGLSFEEPDDEALDLDPATASPIPGQTPVMLLESSVDVLDPTLDLCLAKGLDRLRNLKKLEVLDLASYRRRGYGPPKCLTSATLSSRVVRSAGEAEAKWMAEHWPRLRYARGFGRRSVLVTTLKNLTAGTLKYSFE
ncbi:hypothetical protein BGZ83_006194 [Gryganskiella cystojenkinii]|nr:hypothetical protein BGZ83_006194 [Gryganskiella cystojenkinii]